MLRSGLSSQSFSVDELDAVDPAVEGSRSGPASLSVFVVRVLEAFFSEFCPSLPGFSPGLVA